MAYRHHVNHGMVELLNRASKSDRKEIYERLVLGLNHEQYQKLMLTDLKYNFACNPLLPVCFENDSGITSTSERDTGYEFYKCGLVEIEQNDSEAFGFDNERPRHKGRPPTPCTGHHKR